jgi:hypothetical protein
MISAGGNEMPGEFDNRTYVPETRSRHIQTKCYNREYRYTLTEQDFTLRRNGLAHAVREARRLWREFLIVCETDPTTLTDEQKREHQAVIRSALKYASKDARALLADKKNEWHIKPTLANLKALRSVLRKRAIAAAESFANTSFLGGDGYSYCGMADAAGDKVDSLWADYEAVNNLIRRMQRRERNPKLN